MSYTEAIAQYYGAFRGRDRERLRLLLTPILHPGFK